MTSLDYERHKILIWGKTYPELSTRHFETVCTGGVLEDGSPVRLYPIDYRYLDGPAQFRKYQYITAGIRRSDRDARPESYRVQSDSITIEEWIPPTSDEWGKRAAILFRKPEWQFDSVEDLFAAQAGDKTSIGVVKPKSIERIEVQSRPPGDAESFEEKLEELRRRSEIDRAQLKLFEEGISPELKPLTFMNNRLRVDWTCHGAKCPGHKMQILDWEVLELQRRQGNDAALQKVRDSLDLTSHRIRFFLGNLAQHPTSFTIVGLWYPKIQESALFSGIEEAMLSEGE